MTVALATHWQFVTDFVVIHIRAQDPRKRMNTLSRLLYKLTFEHMALRYRYRINSYYAHTRGRFYPWNRKSPPPSTVIDVRFPSVSVCMLDLFLSV